MPVISSEQKKKMEKRLYRISPNLTPAGRFKATVATQSKREENKGKGYEYWFGLIQLGVVPRRIIKYKPLTWKDARAKNLSITEIGFQWVRATPEGYE